MNRISRQTNLLIYLFLSPKISFFAERFSPAQIERLRGRSSLGRFRGAIFFVFSTRKYLLNSHTV